MTSSEKTLTLYNHLRGYLARDIYPFHMPGHKRNPDFLPPDFFSLDITEIDGMDNLHKPEGVIKELQEKIARIYGSDESFFLVNGSSSGIAAAICAVCDENSLLYTRREAHQSIFHGITLSGARPVYSDYKGADAAVITRPDYYGNVCHIREMARTLHERGGILIVDEAHGAHFPFHCAFPQRALQLGADIVINSFHKTLPAFSQTAVLHVRGRRVDRDKLRYYLRVMQTSSPSYMFMAAADFMLDKITSEPWHFKNYVEKLSLLRNSLPDMNENAAVTLISQAQADIGKLHFWVRSDVDGYAVSKLLTDKYKIQMEMADESFLLAMTSVADTEEGFKRLEYAVEDLNKNLPFINRQGRVNVYAYASPEMVLTPAEAARCKTKVIRVNEADGYIAGEYYTVYPPGIPLLIPGERINRQIAELITQKTIRVINEANSNVKKGTGE